MTVRSFHIFDFDAYDLREKVQFKIQKMKRYTIKIKTDLVHKCNFGFDYPGNTLRRAMFSHVL